MINNLLLFDYSGKAYISLIIVPDLFRVILNMELKSLLRFKGLRTFFQLYL